VLPASDPGYDPPFQKEIITHIPAVGERHSPLWCHSNESGGTAKREGGERRSGPRNAFGMMRLPVPRTVCDESPPRMRVRCFAGIGIEACSDWSKCRNLGCRSVRNTPLHRSVMQNLSANGRQQPPDEPQIINRGSVDRSQ
jgi:hypothetical protein